MTLEINMNVGATAIGTVVEHFLKPGKIERVLAVLHYEILGYDFAGREQGTSIHFLIPANCSTVKENDEVEFRITKVSPFLDAMHECEIIAIKDEKRYEIPAWITKGATVYNYGFSLYKRTVLDVNQYSGNVLLLNEFGGKNTMYFEKLSKTPEDAWNLHTK